MKKPKVKFGRYAGRQARPVPPEHCPDSPPLTRSEEKETQIALERLADGQPNGRRKPSKQLDSTDRSIEQGLDLLVEALISADESRRQAAVKGVKQSCLPAAVRLISERLVILLGRRNSDLARQALASLTELGSPALPCLAATFVGERSALRQRAIVKAVGAIARGLDLEERGSLMIDLMMLIFNAADNSIRQDLRDVVAEFRSAYVAHHDGIQEPEEPEGPGVLSGE
jgi:hypothetical protein